MRSRHDGESKALIVHTLESLVVPQKQLRIRAESFSQFNLLPVQIEEGGSHQLR